MSYLDISNLYKNQDILLFKECYAMEKIHGSSAHLSFYRYPKENHDTIPIIPIYEYSVKYFSGGEKHENFVKLFDEQFLLKQFETLGLDDLIIFGEAYGGKMQGMSHTYGKELKFIAFDIKIGDSWLSVPQAEEIVKQFGLEFVYYIKCSTDIATLDMWRDSFSAQATRNGIIELKLWEGIVLRPLIELKKNNGERVIAKHKNEKFSERTSKKDTIVSSDKLEILKEANAIADEWVTINRLSNILSHLKPEDITIENTGNIIKLFLEDIAKEAKGEIIDSKETRRAISKRAAALYKEFFQNKLKRMKCLQ